jgi:hypothetical protein
MRSPLQLRAEIVPRISSDQQRAPATRAWREREDEDGQSWRISQQQ